MLSEPEDLYVCNFITGRIGRSPGERSSAEGDVFRLTKEKWVQSEMKIHSPFYDGQLLFSKNASRPSALFISRGKQKVQVLRI